jgi:hypothetical protein
LVYQQESLTLGLLKIDKLVRTPGISILFGTFRPKIVLYIVDAKKSE